MFNSPAIHLHQGFELSGFSVQGSGFKGLYPIETRYPSFLTWNVELSNLSTFIHQIA